MNSKYTISQWADAFAELFKPADSQRSPEEVWIATMAHCSSIGEAIRKTDYAELMEYAARTFCWMLSFSKKCQNTDDILFRCENTFCEMVYLKFPDWCGHCTESTCICKPVDVDAKKDKAGKYSKLLEKWARDRRSKGIQYTFEDWLQIFDEIYSGRIHQQSMETLGFHFLEEAGEEAMAVRKLMQLRGILRKPADGFNEKIAKLIDIPTIANEYIRLGKDQPNGKPPYKLNSNDSTDLYARIVEAKMDLVVELADTFSFFCSILIKLGRIKIEPQRTFLADLETALISTYGKIDDGLKCQICKQNPCNCIFFSQVE